MAPAAPTRLSTTKDRPVCRCIRSASSRVRMSTPEPAAAGSTKRTGRLGYSACARAEAGAESTAAVSSRRRVGLCMA